MYFNYDSTTKLTDIELENNDLCLDCTNFDICPLLGALRNNIVYACQHTIEIEQCSMFGIDDVGFTMYE